MPKRSKVKVYEQIRKAHEREGVSVRELARRFHVHRRDVRQALASSVPPARKKPERPAPVLDRWKPTIEGWLEADRTAPRKQRHTARRVWQRLVEEHGAQVGESTVRRYVAEVRRRMDVPLVEVMVPQHHPLGDEAEVDFGTASVVLAGVAVEVSMFVMRLSASGRGYTRAYLNEAQEVFLDGHVRAFEHFGGVPTRIRYDNLKAAVERVLKGRDRVESDRFIALRSHYGFDSFFCQPGIKGSHEKGGVEGEVGRFRRRHLVPVPHVASMAELNELLAAGVARDDERFIAHRRITVAEHFALEADALRLLPAEGFDVSVVASHRVDRKSRVSVRGCLYSVPAAHVGKRLDVRVGAEQVEVLDGARVVACHARALKGDEVLVLDHYLEVLAIKTGAFPGATALARARASGVFGPAHERFWTDARRRLGDRDGTRALIDVLLLHRTIDADALIAGLDRALGAGSIDPAVIAIEARRVAEQAVATVVPIGEGLSRFDRPAPSIANYDDLLEAQ
ncbi:MAG TPA: IS21 family transposase [Microthrixaceae bacterium]|nr:IS21 family transposase [Microthrixaceae bacterium]